MESATEDDLIAREVGQIVATSIARTDLFIHPTLEKEIHWRNRVWLVNLDGDPFGDGNFRITGVKSVARATSVGEAPAAESNHDDPAGPKAAAALEAIIGLWPTGIPDSLTAKDRENQVIAWCKQHSRSVPGPRTIQNVMKARAT